MSLESFWDRARALGDDGYDVMDRARVYRWIAVPSWGRDGWDLGTWPLVVMYHRTAGEQYDLAYYVEGDVTVYRYASRELRDAATDCLAFWHWSRAATSGLRESTESRTPLRTCADRSRGSVSKRRRRISDAHIWTICRRHCYADPRGAVLATRHSAR